MLFGWIALVVIAFIIANQRRVKVGFWFAVITLLIPFIGIVWALVGENQYIRWDEEKIDAAAYRSLKDALPYLDADLKPQARKRLKKLSK